MSMFGLNGEYDATIFSRMRGFAFHVHLSIGTGRYAEVDKTLQCARV